MAWVTLIFAIAKFVWEIIQAIKSRKDLSLTEKVKAINEVITDSTAAKKAIRETGDRKAYDEFIEKYQKVCTGAGCPMDTKSPY